MNCLYILPFLLLGVTSQTPMYIPYATMPSYSTVYSTVPSGYSYDPMRGFYMAGGESGVPYMTAGSGVATPYVASGSVSGVGTGGSFPGTGVVGGMPRLSMIGGQLGYMAIRAGLPMYGGQGQLPLI